MSDPDTPTPNGADSQDEAPKGLRAVAEAAWSEIEATDDMDVGADVSRETSEAAQEQRQRDSLGRFVSSQDDGKEPGEQSQDPARKQQPPASVEQQPPVQPPPGSSNEAPQHWSAEDRASFAKLPKEGQEFLLRRHTAMEQDYQSKMQANATAVQFTQALAPIFEHPQMAASLANVEGRPLHPVHAVRQWAAYHLRAMSPNVEDRAGLLREMAQRMQLDPAAVFGQGNPPPGLSEQDMQDPAIKYFADTLGRSLQEINALKGQLQAVTEAGNQRQADETLRVTRWGIDTFADEKNAQGQLLHPHFDTVLPQMIELFRADPRRDLKQAYETAVWMNPQLRQTLISQEKATVSQRQANERASLAARGNVRGRTSPVSKPSPEDGNPKGLRATIAAAADEVGI